MQLSCGPSQQQKPTTAYLPAEGLRISWRPEAVGEATGYSISAPQHSWQSDLDPHVLGQLPTNVPPQWHTLTNYQLCRPHVMRGVMRQLRTNHDRNQVSSSEVAAPGTTLSRIQNTCWATGHDTDVVDVQSVINRIAAVEASLEGLTQMVAHIHTDLRAADISHYNGHFKFTPKGPTTAAPVLEAIASLELNAGWPALVTEQVALPAYLGRAPNAAETLQMRLIRARGNACAYLEACASVGPTMHASKRLLLLMMQDQVDLQQLPALTFIGV